MNYRKYRVGFGYDIEDIEALLFFAAVALSEDNAEMQIAMFRDCLLAYEHDIGSLHVIEEDSRQIGFCFVLDAGDTPKGAKHIHLISVVKSQRMNWAGSYLLDLVMTDIKGQPVTLESKAGTRNFFSRHGFSVRGDALQHGYYAMYANSDGEKDEFKIMGFCDITRKEYEQRFCAVAQRLGFN